MKKYQVFFWGQSDVGNCAYNWKATTPKISEWRTGKANVHHEKKIAKPRERRFQLRGNTDVFRNEWSCFVVGARTSCCRRRTCEKIFQTDVGWTRLRNLGKRQTLCSHRGISFNSWDCLMRDLSVSYLRASLELCGTIGSARPSHKNTGFQKISSRSRMV